MSALFSHTVRWGLRPQSHFVGRPGRQQRHAGAEHRSANQRQAAALATALGRRCMKSLATTPTAGAVQRAPPKCVSVAARHFLHAPEQDRFKRHFALAHARRLSATDLDYSDNFYKPLSPHSNLHKARVPRVRGFLPTGFRTLRATPSSSLQHSSRSRVRKSTSVIHREFLGRPPRMISKLLLGVHLLRFERDFRVRSKYEFGVTPKAFLNIEMKALGVL